MPFIHSRLYHSGLPKRIQDTLAIWAVYMTMTKDNKMALFQIMEAKVAELIGRTDWREQRHDVVHCRRHCRHTSFYTCTYNLAF